MRALLACTTLLSVLAAAAPAQIELQSSDHDTLRLTMSGALAPLTETATAIGSRMAAVCLGNGTDAIKGFDNQPAAAPRHVAGAGAATCARWEPTGHIVYFYKRHGTGWRPVLSYRLDLRDRDGLLIRIDWLND